MTNLIEIFPGIFEAEGRLFTRNLLPGYRCYDEGLIKFNGVEYRVWNAFHSKLGAGIQKGLKELHIKEGSNILYLGCAEGRSVSHLSDIVGLKGIVFGVDISARSMQLFIQLSVKRENLLPILADANQPEEYQSYLEGQKIDLLFQDVAQKNQAEILCKNAMYLEKGTQAILSLKARSVQSHINPEEILHDELIILKKVFEVKQIINLAPMEEDHYLIDCRKK